MKLGWLLPQPRQPGIAAPQLLQWLEDAPQGLIVVDPWNRLQHLNGRGRRLLGISTEQEVNNRFLLEVVRCHQLDQAVQTARSSGSNQRVTWTHTAVSASPLEPEPIRSVPFEAIAMPGSHGWVGVFLQSRQSLESRQLQQERWISDVAHELRTPLTALSLVTDSLAENPKGKQAIQIERLQQELARLQQLVSDLLVLNRLDNPPPGGADSQERVIIRELVNQAWQNLIPLAEPRGVHLILDSSGPHAVRGNSSQLYRALFNLLDNALRFSPDDSAIEVQLNHEGRWQRVSVRDHGQGFSADDLQHMFQRFYRGDPSRARVRQVGSGLGLAIVQQIANSHGGQIRAVNHIQGGAQMQLSLPANG
jgi:two-component system phosphate regulon sensor histidine kinase PhoR